MASRLVSLMEPPLLLERENPDPEVLVRAVDRRAAGSNGWPINANTVMAWQEVRQLGRNWGNLIRRRLDDFDSIDDLQ